MHDQGHKVENNTSYQDNQSTTLMLKTGENLCTRNSRHINIRHFFVKDRIENKEIKVEHCPSENMLGDFFLKYYKVNCS